MERYNIFKLIHKGLKASVYYTALQLQQTDFTIEDEKEEALNQVREIVMLFECYVKKEDSFILTVINQYEPSVAVSFEEEQEKHQAPRLQLQNSIENLEKSSAMPEKLTAVKNLIESFETYIVFNLQRMSGKENVLNKILWRYYTDDDILNIHVSINKSIAPWLHDFYNKWMIRGINNEEASGWLKDVKKNMPHIVFLSLLQKAENELPGHRFCKIKYALSERKMIESLSNDLAT